MIYYRIVWSTDKNIGAAYNREMQMLPYDDDFCCFIDADAMFLTPFFGKQLERIVEAYPECGAFTCTTNRVNCKWQLAEGGWMNDDIKYHRLIAERSAQKSYLQVEDVSRKPRGKVMSGVLMLIRRDVWRKVGGFKDGMLGVDNDFHWKIMDNNERLYLMKGVYVYHWYRGGDYSNKSHLK